MSRRTTHTVTRISAVDSSFADALRWELQLFGIANGYASSADIAAGRMCWYTRYDAASEFYVARDSQGELAGITRLVRHDAQLGIQSFSTIVDARSYSAHGEPPRSYLDLSWEITLSHVSPHSVAELATQAVGPQHRRFRAMDALWQSMIAACRGDGVELWTVALVVPLFRFYKALLPNAIHAIGTLMPDYVGADSIPAVLQLTHGEVDAYLNGSNDERRSEVSNGSDVSQTISRGSPAL